MNKFVSPESYYDTAFHECVHSTGSEKRLNRKETVASREAYSKEELIAEIGSCYIMHKLGIETPMTFENNVAYLQSWLMALKNDKRMIVYAASAAAKAAEYVLSGKNSESTCNI